MLENLTTVVCYNCSKTYTCNYLGYPVTRKCPSCGELNRIMAPDTKGKCSGVKPRFCYYEHRKLKVQ